jgi:preprotein translocase subunit SecG
VTFSLVILRGDIFAGESHFFIRHLTFFLICVILGYGVFIMGVLNVFLLVIFVIAAVLLILLVLVQSEDGDSMGGIFAGGSSSAFGSRSGNVLTKASSILGGLFLVLSLTIALLNRTPGGTGVEAAGRQAVSTEAGDWWKDDNARVATEVEDEVQKLGIGGISAKAVDEGVTISLESDIGFEPESAALPDADVEKLRSIVPILRKYPDRGISVFGHSALIGNGEGADSLSEARASAAADYLAQEGLRSRDSITVRGYGADRPVADNDTEEGRSKNQRVEITLLKK